MGVTVLVAYRFADRIEPHKDRIPEEARRVIEEEMAKLSGLESASSEFNVTRNYLDWLTAIPWGHYTQERLDIQHAQRVRLCHGFTPLTPNKKASLSV